MKKMLLWNEIKDLGWCLQLKKELYLDISDTYSHAQAKPGNPNLLCYCVHFILRFLRCLEAYLHFLSQNIKSWTW